MKDVGFTAVREGVLNYLGSFKKVLPESMHAGAGFVNWAPVLGMIWGKLYSYRDTDHVNNGLREAHRACSGKETRHGISGTNLPVHLASLSGLFGCGKAAEEDIEDGSRAVSRAKSLPMSPMG